MKHDTYIAAKVTLVWMTVSAIVFVVTVVTLIIDWLL